MRRFVRFLAAAVTVMLVGGCGDDAVEPDHDLAVVAFDTVTVIGALEGEDWEVFGAITSAAMSARGDIAVLDLQARRVSVFNPDGDFTASVAARGEGPGELNQPWGIGWMGEDKLIITDRGNARISQFLLDESALEFVDAMPMEFPMGHICTIGERVFAAAYRAQGTIHSVDWQTEQFQTFGAVPDLAVLDGLAGGFRELALRQWTTGRLLCDETGDQVLEVGTLNGNLRLFRRDGAPIWEQRLEDLYTMEPVVEDGSFFGRPDEVTGAHVAQSALLWDSEHALVQHELRFPDDTEGDDQGALESRLIDLETGAVQGRSNALPRIAGRSVDRFISVRNVPYPQVLILERVFQ